MKVVILALSESGEEVARTIAANLNVPLHGRIDRVRHADVYFNNALEHIRDLFISGYSIVGVCASGVLVRAIAPFLSCLLYTSPSPRDLSTSRMPSSA